MFLPYCCWRWEGGMEWILLQFIHTFIDRYTIIHTHLPGHQAFTKLYFFFISSFLPKWSKQCLLFPCLFVLLLNESKERENWNKGTFDLTKQEGRSSSGLSFSERRENELSSAEERKKNDESERKYFGTLPNKCELTLYSNLWGQGRRTVRKWQYSIVVVSESLYMYLCRV